LQGKPSNWEEAKTGTPITLKAWHGEPSHKGRVSETFRAKMGRERLLGDGWYGAADQDIAADVSETRRRRA